MPAVESQSPQRTARPAPISGDDYHYFMNLTQEYRQKFIQLTEEN